MMPIFGSIFVFQGGVPYYNFAQPYYNFLSLTQKGLLKPEQMN